MVRDEPQVLVVDSGLDCDTFNVVAGARFEGDDAEEAIAGIVSGYGGRAFSWWVGPGDGPEDLGRRLLQAGLEPVEAETAMRLELAALREPSGSPPELRVVRVRTVEGLGDFAAVNAANWSPPDPLVMQFYGETAQAALAERSPLLFFVGYVEGAAVAACELCLGVDAAGIYNVSTRAACRGRGYGSAVTLEALREAQRREMAAVELQASADGLRIYERLGFRPAGHYQEFKPRSGESRDG